MPAIIVPAAVAAAAAAELPRIFDDALDTLREGEAQYLKDGQPTSLTGRISQAAGRSACRIYSTGDVDLSPAAAEKYERACRPYLDDIYPPSRPTIEQPFRGGQCEAVYSVNMTMTQKDGLPSITLNNRVRGPIGGFRITSTSPFQGQVFARNNITNNANCGNLPAQAPAWRNVGLGGTNFEGQSIKVNSITPCGLDNCGSVPPEVIQPDPNPDPTPPPFRFNPGPDIDVDIDVDVDVDGSITINVGTGPITVNPFGGGGGGASGNDPVGGPGTPGAGGDTSAGGQQGGEADSGEELVGVLVQILSAPLDANRFFNNSELVYRGAYYVAMGYSGRLGLDMSGGTAETLQFFHAQQRGLTHYRVRANVGFNLRVTPYYRELES